MPAAPLEQDAARPRLLLITTVYPTPWQPNTGPANRSKVEALRALGCEVCVVAPVPWPKRIGRRSVVAPIEHYPAYWYLPGILRSHFHSEMQWSIGRELGRIAAQFRPDAVLGIWADPDGTVALRLAKSLGVPGGVVAIGSDLMILPADPSRRRVIAATMQQADHVFAVGSVLRRKAIELGAAPERVSNFLAGVDLHRFGPGDRAAARTRFGLTGHGPLLLSVGSLVPVKATERLLYAAAQLAPDHPDLTVVLVGDGPRRPALERIVAATPVLSGRVTFAGPVSHDQLPDWYRAADLLVLPSRSEGVPNVLLEAMTCGLPFVASDVGSISDLLPFGPSTVVAEGDIAALTNAMDAILRAGLARVVPRPFDRLDGARELLRHLGLSTGAQ